VPRKLFTVASLLLCAATAVLWIRSYRVHDRIGVSTSWARYTLHSDHGRLVLMRPPDPGSETGLAWRMAQRISNDDVMWEPYSRGPGTDSYRLRSHIRRNSDTWAMYDRFDFRGGCCPRA